MIIEDNGFRDSRGIGVFIDGYVSDATIRNYVIEGTGSAGIYLETGSRRTRVENNVIHDNGHRENGPGGQIDEFGGLRIRWWGIVREGLAVDGSYGNVVAGDSFEGNSHSGILLYTSPRSAAASRQDRWASNSGPSAPTAWTSRSRVKPDPPGRGVRPTIEARGRASTPAVVVGVTSPNDHHRRTEPGPRGGCRVTSPPCTT